ncbi:MAG: hypothetical protein ACRDQZ_03860 [Mycobacteriales bacterium]
MTQPSGVRTFGHLVPVADTPPRPTPVARDAVSGIDRLSDLDFSGQHRVQRTLATFVDGKFPRGQVGGGLNEALQVIDGQRRK